MFLDLVKKEIIRSGTVCRVAEVRQALVKDEQLELDAAIAGNFAATAICRALNKIGHEIGATSINRHRRGECACSKS